MPGQLDGKVAVVTGAVGGFGSGIVAKYLEEGASIIAWDLVEAPLQKLADANKGRLVPLVGDVTKLADWEKALELGQQHFGKVDIVVNNAGILTQGRPTHTSPLEDFDRMMNINVKPLYLSTQVFVPHMRERGSGVFVTVASTTAKRPRPEYTFYSASKAAVVCSSAVRRLSHRITTEVKLYTQAMAVEYAPTIRFNTLSPAIGATPMFANILNGRPDTPETRKAIAHNIPLGRFADGQDIGNMACFLASDASSYCTGCDYPICGGRSA